VKTPGATRLILHTLEAQHPDADTELHYRSAFELLVATILSAQSTDQRVNMVTPALFARYPDAGALAEATTDALEPQIHSTGFFRAKSKALVGMARALVARHGGEVPADMEALTALPGVGRKTANVVLGHALGVPGLPVDRHVLRVSNRIGIAESDDPEVVEQQLCAALPKERWTRSSDTLILHGRRICKPRPLCEQCAVQDDCLYFSTSVAAESRHAKPGGHGPRKGSAQGKEPAERKGRAERRHPQRTGHPERQRHPERKGARPAAGRGARASRRRPKPRRR
jgi:endonuclease-3